MDEEYVASELVAASRQRLVEAYDSWLKQKGRSRRQEKPCPDGHSNQVFLNSLKSFLALDQGQNSKKLGIPSTRSGWANWRRGRGAPIIRIRLDVCRAIYTLTNIDVTANQFLTDQPVNATELVSIGPASLQVDEISLTSQTVSLEYLVFRATEPKEIILADVKNSYSSHEKDRVLGTIRFALTQASLSLKGSHSWHPILKQIKDGTESNSGSSIGADISFDDEEKTRWRIQPNLESRHLTARLENLVLCSGEKFQDFRNIVCVSVAISDIDASLHFEDRDSISNDEYKETKKKLVERLLSMRMVESLPRRAHIIAQSPATFR